VQDRKEVSRFTHLAHNSTDRDSHTQTARPLKSGSLPSYHGAEQEAISEEA
jgi:hypothetical protein